MIGNSVWSAGCVLLELRNHLHMFRGRNEEEQLDLYQSHLSSFVPHDLFLFRTSFVHLFRDDSHGRAPSSHSPPSQHHEHPPSGPNPVLTPPVISEISGSTKLGHSHTPDGMSGPNGLCDHKTSLSPLSSLPSPRESKTAEPARTQTRMSTSTSDIDERDTIEENRLWNEFIRHILACDPRQRWSAAQAHESGFCNLRFLSHPYRTRHRSHRISHITVPSSSSPSSLRFSSPPFPIPRDDTK